ncbi:uncharacterized protein LOC131180069 [Hevea brasiliensis]|uniref:uncharacterized protein LOC131180069 n=1 Tax=Hevea brasiliensis TaxID=3981 RepID=UPI0025DB959E|nr:uncharacterized protein LOC131180069 [Hevea brasiliensis]
MEMKNKCALVKKQLRRCGFGNWSIVDPRDQQDYFLHVCITDSLITANWDMLFVYASSVDSDRIAQFNLLENYKSQLKKEAVVIGDFNSLLNSREKKGGNSNFNYKILPFRNLINNLGLMDMGYMGPHMTWNNQRDGPHHIKERLDRALATPHWLFLYSSALVYHLEDLRSDHCPILLSMDPTMEKAKRRFTFDRRWANLQKVQNVIFGAWQQNTNGHKLFQVFNKLKNC